MEDMVLFGVCSTRWQLFRVGIYVGDLVSIVNMDISFINMIFILQIEIGIRG